MRKLLLTTMVVSVSLFSSSTVAQCPENDLDGVADNQRDDLDGLADLVLRFRGREMRAPTAEECGNPLLHRLTGSTIDGRLFHGSERVTFVGSACSR